MLQTLSEYVILIAFPLQQWLHERSAMLRYTYTACLVMTEMESIYCAVRNESLNKTDYVSSLKG